MKESDYILISDLTRLRTAKDCLRPFMGMNAKQVISIKEASLLIHKVSMELEKEVEKVVI